MILGAALSVTEGEPECAGLGGILDSVDGDSDPVVLVLGLALPATDGGSE